jgi:isoamylase
VPMLLAGDEFGRSQDGNSNAYCQDSEVSWLDWDGMRDEGRALLASTRQLIALRRAHIVFHRHRFFRGETIPGTEVKDVVWLRPDAAEMSETDWRNPQAKALAVRLSGEPGHMHLTERGEQEPDDTFLVLMNASHNDITFRLPADSAGTSWEVLVDTAFETEDETLRTFAPGCQALVNSNSLCLLVLRSRLAR